MAGLAQELADEEEGLKPLTHTAHYQRYLAIILICSVGISLLAYPMARSDYYERISRRMFWHAMDYHMQMAGQRCDVVVFGDSTSLTGIDPEVLRQQTGLSACVLSMPYMALSTTGTLVLDRFLARSPAPRLIIFANHARHLHAPGFDENNGVIDGWLLVDRIQPPLQAAKFFLRHPGYSAIFMEGVWQQVFTMSPVTAVDLSQRTYRRDMDILRAHSGFFPIPQQIYTPDLVCALKMDVPADDLSYLPSLRSRYQTATTKVLMYVSPVRACDENLTAYREIAERLHVKPPTIYDPHEFTDAWHLNPGGATRNSNEISREIRAVLQRGGEG
jgi:hypothetical protein